MGADGYFIRATAWYLNMEIQIMDTKCKEDEPYYTIDGDFSGEGCSDILYIGYVSGVHYQSLSVDYDKEFTVSDDSFEVLDDGLEQEDIEEKTPNVALHTESMKLPSDKGEDIMETDDAAFEGT